MEAASSWYGHTYEITSPSTAFLQRFILSRRLISWTDCRAFLQSSPLEKWHLIVHVQSVLTPHGFENAHGFEDHVIFTKS